MRLFRQWMRWLAHGVRILVGGFGAYLIIAIPIGLFNLLSDASSGGLFASVGLVLLGLFLIPSSIAAFGFLFTKLYTATTWGHNARNELENGRNSQISGNAGHQFEEANTKKY